MLPQPPERPRATRLADDPHLASFCHFLSVYVDTGAARHELESAMELLVRHARAHSIAATTVLAAVEQLCCPVPQLQDEKRLTPADRYTSAVAELAAALESR